jgi:hypothetical protein
MFFRHHAAGFLSGMVGSKGDLKQGLLGALTAGFNAKVLHPMKAGFRKLIAHGLTGGVRSRLSGGSFKSGFLGSAVSYGASWSGAYKAAGVSNQANTWTQRVQNVVASYVVGGVAAELGGGKFANGGMSAAFSRMFNDLKNNNTVENSKCGNAPVSCIATSTGGIGKYQDGNKLARYNCSNSGGNCSFVAQGDGEHVYGAKLGTSWHPDYGAFTRAYGVEGFIVNPNDTFWDLIWNGHKWVNHDFINKLKVNQLP